MRGSFALFLLAIVATLCPASSAATWTCLRSPNFELCTSAGEGLGRELIARFERYRTAFIDVLGVKLPETRSVIIVAFRDAQEFAPYTMHQGVSAYYVASTRRDYIVMQDLAPEHYPVALHEYTHLIISQAGMKLPLWLNEGFAELYSTLTPAGKKILVGRMLPGRIQVAQAGLADLRSILRADYRSPLYNESSRMGVFYAESWAFVHMLKFNKAYAPGFDQVLDAIGRGDSSEHALETAYGKPIEQIQHDLELYVHANKFYEGVIKARLPAVDVQVQALPSDPVGAATLLAGIQALTPQRDAARNTLEALAAQNPQKLEPFEALAWMSLTGPDPRGAIEPFRRALALGTRDAALCFEYATRLRAGIPGEEYVAALRKAAGIDPATPFVQRLLAAYAFNHQDYAEAFSRLHQVKKLDRAQAFSYYRALAYAAFRLGKLDEAKAAAQRSIEFSTTPDEHRLADEMVAYVSGQLPGTVPPIIEDPQPLR